jgi:hypothetical protein
MLVELMPLEDVVSECLAALREEELGRVLCYNLKVVEDWLQDGA